MWQELVVVCVVALGRSQGVFQVYPRAKELGVLGEGDPGEPLFITPYLESGDILEAQAAASVNLHPETVSYSGFFTVDKDHQSDIFFWYFPAEKNPKNAPVVLWLQGGPGGSSLFGLFSENGPFYIGKEGVLRQRKYGSWNQDFHLVYFDNPVGTGFSKTGDLEGYAKNEEDVGRNLREATEQFFKLFPDLVSRPFFITGESYAGKYVPALAHALRGSTINLQGIAMGDGYSAPDLMLNYSDYLYQIGLIDTNDKVTFKAKEDEIRDLMDKKEWLAAGQGLDELMGGQLFFDSTGFTFMYNYLHNRDDSPFGDMDTFLQQASVRKSIHVGNLTFHSGIKVADCLKFDFPQSVKPWIEELLEETRVMIYSGQLDIIVAYPLTVNFLQNLEWSGSSLYKTAERKPWYYGNQLAGYTKTVKRLTEVLVRNAGHMVPMDQPLWAHDMIRRFVFNKSF